MKRSNQTNQIAQLARDAVVRGYIYRKLYAEQLTRHGHIKVAYSVAFDSPLLELLAQAIIGGIAYDVFKAMASTLWTKVFRATKYDARTLHILNSPDEQELFYSWIKEYAERELRKSDHALHREPKEDFKFTIKKVRKANRSKTAKLKKKPSAKSRPKKKNA